MEVCFISDVECLIITLSIVEIHVSSLDVRRSVVHLNCAVIKDKSGFALLSDINDVMLALTGLILKNEIKDVPYTSGMESTYRFTLLLGNTFNHLVGINSKAFPFETSSCLKLSVIRSSIPRSSAALTRGSNGLMAESLSRGRSTAYADRGSKKEYFISVSFWVPFSPVLQGIQRSRGGKMKVNNNVDGVLGYRTNLNYYKNYIYNNIYRNTVGEIRNDKENLMVINNDSERKDLGIKAEDEEEVKGVTGDEEVDVEVYSWIEGLAQKKSKCNQGRFNFHEIKQGRFTCRDDRKIY
ncbi:myb-like protein X [Vespula maculifrons]|uniref:Myb-like protein X n=1 Tax=Vespula maculifrons TaxID=7453 RepID=A0ABD2AGG7_VESMC